MSPSNRPAGISISTFLFRYLFGKHAHVPHIVNYHWTITIDHLDPMPVHVACQHTKVYAAQMQPHKSCPIMQSIRLLPGNMMYNPYRLSSRVSSTDPNEKTGKFWWCGTFILMCYLVERSTATEISPRGLSLYENSAIVDISSLVGYELRVGSTLL